MNKKLLSFIAFTTVSFIGVGEFNDIKAKSFNNCSEAWSQGYGNIKKGEDGYSKHLDKDGDGIACEIKKSNGKFKPQVHSGWIKKGDYWYYVNNGVLVTSTWMGNYYLKSTGEMASSEWIYDNQYKAWYYLKEDGSYAKNVWIGNYWLGSDGKMVTNSWVDNGRYYVGSDGVWIKNYNARSGWSKEGEKWYYYKNGILLKNTWQGSCYLKSTGEMASSEWIYDNQYKAWYYLKEDGNYAKNVWIGNYWLGSDGKMVTNSWVDNGRYYVGDNGAWIPKK